MADTRKVATGETCPNGYPIYEHQSLMRTGQGDFWRTDYKSCCPADCVNADQPGV